MATLFDSTMADLRVLSINEAVSDKVPAVAENMELDTVAAVNRAAANCNTVSKLYKTSRYIDVMQIVDASLEKSPETFSSQGNMLDEDTYSQLITDCFALSLDINREYYENINFLLATYGPRYDCLSTLYSVDLARLVIKMGNETDLARVDMTGIVSSPSIVSKNLSTATVKPLPQDVLEKGLDASHQILVLSSAREKIRAFVLQITEKVAPNLSVLVGGEAAAKLISGTAGGLSALASIPACNFRLPGPLTDLKEFLDAMPQFCYLGLTDFVWGLPPGLKFLVYLLVARQSTVAAQVDATRGDPTGNTGRRIQDQVLVTIVDWKKLPYPGKHLKKNKLKLKDNNLKLKKLKDYNLKLKKLKDNKLKLKKLKDNKFKLKEKSRDACTMRMMGTLLHDLSLEQLKEGGL